MVRDAGPDSIELTLVDDSLATNRERDRNYLLVDFDGGRYAVDVTDPYDIKEVYSLPDSEETGNGLSARRVRDATFISRIKIDCESRIKEMMEPD